MANSSLTLSSIDFDSLKENFKEFLKTQSVFKDYDFSGSNINVLLDVMSYNSYLNAFYLNMVASEMFLDSAQKYDSIVSHAKELNYVPRSAHSSVAEVEVVLSTTGIDGKITIPKGTRFTGLNSNGNFIFTTDETKIFVSGNSTFTLANLQIYEGSYFNDSYLVDYDIENQQFLITNKNVDTNSITVNVIENNGETNTIFIRAETLFGLNDTSNVYFLQASQNGQYEVVFGDGLFGRNPLNSSVININYRIASGNLSDGITSFTLSDDLGPVNNGSAQIESFTVITPSSSGSSQESIESVRFAAPRYFATQQRAVTSDDYTALILNNFGGEISDVIVYGGQETEPKLYGRVIVSLKPASGTIAPDYIKNKITNYLKEYIALPNRIIINDPDYFYCGLFTEVQYNKNVTSKTAEEIKFAALSAITNYSLNNLEKFGNDFRYSRLISEIDNADTSIVSNDTDFRIIKRITPNFDQKTTYKIFFGNVLYYDATNFSTNEQHKILHESELDARSSHATLISSRFSYNSTDGKVYDLAFFEDDADGNILLYAPIEEEILPIETVGTINYSTGEVTLTDINVSSYTNHISIYVRSRFKDIIATQNKIIVIDPNDVSVSVVEIKQ